MERTSPKDCLSKNRWLKFFKKWHRWPGLIIGLFFILWAISGIVMNHRQLFSGFDINRKYLPKEHNYVNWNNAAVKSGVSIGNDSLLIYGNIGIWLTDSSFSRFTEFSQGFPTGIDNRKISSMLVTDKGHIYAGSLFGLFYYDFPAGKWIKLNLPVKDERIQWLEKKEDSIIVLTRSALMIARNVPENFTVYVKNLPPPVDYDDKVSLFRTIWVIHSGEIYGLAGKLIVDLLGLIVIMLTVTGILHFTMPYALRHRKKNKKSTILASATKKTSARWHKKAGIWIALFLLINTITGMFLRPPLLFAIANTRVGKIPWSIMDIPNPLADKLRAVIFDEKINGYIIGTNEDFYYAQQELSSRMIPLPGQPPVSIMGINVFKKLSTGTYLVGSFNGLYEWSPENGLSRNHINLKTPQKINTRSKPFGEEMVNGYLKFVNGEDVYFDYNKGAVTLNRMDKFPAMPTEIIKESPMSWWNFALEVHTGRIFKPFVGDFYILIVPLLGIFGTILVISGLVIWIKLYVRKIH